MMAPDPSVVSEVPSSLLTALCIAVVSLAGVCAFLFKYYSSKADEMAKERQLWAIERTKLEMVREADSDSLRAEYETKHRLLAEDSTKAVRALYDLARERETEARREYLQNMEVVSAEASKAHEKIGAILDKALDRFVGSRSRQ